MWTAEGESLEVATHLRFFTEVPVLCYFLFFSNIGTLNLWSIF